jgi:hypothetical protein
MSTDLHRLVCRPHLERSDRCGPGSASPRLFRIVVDDQGRKNRCCGRAPPLTSKDMASGGRVGWEPGVVVAVELWDYTIRGEETTGASFARTLEATAG